MASVLTGHGKTIERIDEETWKQAVVTAVEHMPQRLAFMTPAHHRVRNAAVRHLPGNDGRPLTIEQVAAAAGVPEPAARSIVAELERNLFFVVRQGEDRISWAFPVTSDTTPHRLLFDSGESIFGA